MTEIRTQNEKLLAAFSYWGTWVLWFLPALIIFLVQAEKSPFVKRHALQGLILSLIITVVPGMLTFSFMMMGMPFMLPQLLGLAGGVYAIVLGVWIMQDKDPSIPVLSDMLGGSSTPAA